MKLIVRDNEMGFLYKNGAFSRLLTAGKHTVYGLFGESAFKMPVVGMVGAVFSDEMNLSVLRKDETFKKYTATMEVPDGCFAARFEGGNLSGVLAPGVHIFWNVKAQNTFELFDMKDPNSANSLPVNYFIFLPPSWYRSVSVPEGHVGVLLFDGAYSRTLQSGQYYFWNTDVSVKCLIIDTRLCMLDVSGQEILTADKVALRVNFVCSYRVQDPVKAALELKDYEEQLHVAAQLALRELAGKYRFDELLKQKDAIGAQVLERLKEREGEFYVRFTDAGVKDIILPGEIRAIMNTVLIAEKAAQASVITRREETAATKSLLETAKLMDENATLFKLKELEYLERICDKVGNISVGGGGILENLRELLCTNGSENFVKL